MAAQSDRARQETAAAPDVIRVDDLKIYFGRRTPAKAVDGVSFTIGEGETVAVVGESGSGKSITSLGIMGLLPDGGGVAGGSIRYRTRGGAELNLTRLGKREMRAVRGREIAMIFQEPMTSLNPLFTIGDQIIEMIRLHTNLDRNAARERARRLLELVEIPAAATRLDNYPHELSGGMRQRVMIALALSCDPRLLIADEPTTALDVTVQAQILDLLRRLQQELGMSIIFVTHNLGVVAEIAHQVVVMYAGRVVEQAPVRDLFARPRHPYTKALLTCIPNAGRNGGERPRLQPIPGTVPGIAHQPAGCTFNPRCPLATNRCRSEVPPLAEIMPLHRSRCWRAEEL